MRPITLRTFFSAPNVVGIGSKVAVDPDRAADDIVRVVQSAGRVFDHRLRAGANAEVGSKTSKTGVDPGLSGLEVRRIAFMRTCREIGGLSGLSSELIADVARRLYPGDDSIAAQALEFGLVSSTRPDVTRFRRDRSNVIAVQGAFAVLIREIMLKYLSPDEVKVILEAKSMDGRHNGLDTFQLLTVYRQVPRFLNLLLFRISLPPKRIPMARLELDSIAPDSIRESTDVPLWTIETGVVARSIFYDPSFLEIAGGVMRLYDAKIKEIGGDPYKNRRATYV